MAENDELTRQVISNKWFGGLDLVKGVSSADVDVIAWDSAGLCTMDKCPIITDCDRAFGIRDRIAREEEVPKCVVQATYLNTVHRMLVEEKGEKLSASDSVRIGLMVLPLFGQLIRFKLWEIGLGGDIIIGSDKGKIGIHPVYREMREVMKLINTIVRDMGRDTKLAIKRTAKRIMDGDPEYYELLYEDNPTENTGFEEEEIAQEPAEGEPKVKWFR